MGDQGQRIRLAEAIVQRWNEEGRRYAVVHGLEEYPNRIGRDLDIVVDMKDVPSLVRSAILVSEEKGFPHIFFRWSYWGLYQLVFINNDINTSLALDLLCTTDVWRAKLVQFVDDSVLERFVNGDGLKGPFRISSAGRFCKVYLRSLLCGDVNKILKEYVLPVVVPDGVADVVDNVLGEYGRGLLRESDAKKLGSEFPAAVWRLQIDWCKRHPLKCLESVLLALKGRAARSLLNPPFTVVVKGNVYDKGKFDHLRKSMRELFVDLRVKAIKPGRPVIVDKVSNPPTSEFVILLYLDFVDRAGERPRRSFDLEIFDDSLDIQTIKVRLINALKEKYKVPGVGL